MSDNVKNILIIKPSAIGDIVTALPVLKPLREKYPNAKISWLVRKEFAAIIDDHKNIDELVIFDRKGLGRWWKSGKSFKALYKFLDGLKRNKYDLVIDLQGLFRTGFFTGITRAKTRLGMANAREGATMFYNRRIAPPTDSFHVIDLYRKIVGDVCDISGDVCFDLEVEKNSDDFATKLLGENNVDIDNYIVLVPGASRPDKFWPAEKFAEVGDSLKSKFGCEIVVVGSGGESVLAEKIEANSSCKTVNLCGKTNLKQLIAVLAKAKLVVSNDTGPAHIAYALGTQTLIVFGRTNAKRVGVYGCAENSICVGYEERAGEIESDKPAHDIANVEVSAVLNRAYSILGND